jgi:hypothetical protein
MLALRRVSLAAAIVMAVVSVSCTSADPEKEPTSMPAEENGIVGVLTDEGAECPAMRGDDGELYTLMPRGITEGFGMGDRVRVTGTAAEVSICQQGITIDVERIEHAS